MTVPDSDFAAFDREDAAAQLAGLLELLPDRAQVADLGAGRGRVSIPLADHGASVLAIDHSRAALDFNQWTKRTGVRGIHEDFLGEDPEWVRSGTLDLVCCLGNTLALIHEDSRLSHLFALADQATGPRGRLVFDDLAFWSHELRDPHDWPGGISQDGSQQLAWVPDAPFFAYRTGSEVDSTRPRPDSGERLLRLWSAAEMNDLAVPSGWAPAVHLETGLIMSFLKEN
ncbi:MAG: hypothetical protein CBC35_12005 [Planctomycetes bacterium TMED75]|nr:hypothetical protein [Planctomycetaceae bacterium]OUU90453.1 MAG: hypothetical protein CBC35_12005 [Planctomycetes bacterium TMED75]